jgi:hypothetical protein
MEGLFRYNKGNKISLLIALSYTEGPPALILVVGEIPPVLLSTEAVHDRTYYSRGERQLPTPFLLPPPPPQPQPTRQIYVTDCPLPTCHSSFSLILQNCKKLQLTFCLQIKVHLLSLHKNRPIKGYITCRYWQGAVVINL